MATSLTPIALDYAEAANATLLRNLSGVAAIGDALWTVSDEGRSLECLRRTPMGYGLAAQYRLDDIIADLPGAADGDELDLESIDIADGALWLCGSHCRVRRKPKKRGGVNPAFRDRRSRCVLAAIALSPDGFKLGHAKAAPFKGKGSLRRTLGADPYLAPSSICRARRTAWTSRV